MNPLLCSYLQCLAAPCSNVIPAFVAINYFVPLYYKIVWLMW